jgi:hypothetical protein
LLCVLSLDLGINRLKDGIRSRQELEWEEALLKVAWAFN